MIAVIAALALPAAAEAKRNVYVSNAGSDNVSAFDIAADGSLGPIGSPVAVGDGPVGVAVSPDGAHLYVANRDSDNVSAFDIAPSGALGPLAGSPVAAGDGPRGVAAGPDGAHLYVANAGSDNVSAFDIGADGSLGPIGTPVAAGDAPFGVAASPDGAHLYVANVNSDDVSAFDIAADGSLGPIGSPVAAGDAPEGLAVSPDGAHLYVANFLSDDVSAFDIAADGSLGPIGSPVAAGDAPVGAAVNPDGAHLYVANGVSDNVSAYGIAADGSLGPIGSPVAAGDFPEGVAVSPDGARLYVTDLGTNNVFAYGIAADGSLSSVGGPFPTGGTSADFQSVAITPNQGPAAAFSSAGTEAGEPLAFDASASADPDGQIARYAWDFGDGTTLADGGPTPSHAYAEPGTFTVRLTVTDNEGCSTELVFTGQTAHCNGGPAAVARRNVTVTEPPSNGEPPPDAEQPSNQFSFGKLRQHKGNGTATLSVDVPAPGSVVLAQSKEVKPAAKETQQAGSVKLKLRPRGKAKRRLSAKQLAKSGKKRLEVGVKAKVTYTPTGGEPNTKQRKMQLIRR